MLSPDANLGPQVPIFGIHGPIGTVLPKKVVEENTTLESEQSLILLLLTISIIYFP